MPLFIVNNLDCKNLEEIYNIKEIRYIFQLLKPIQ